LLLPPLPSASSLTLLSLCRRCCSFAAPGAVLWYSPVQLLNGVLNFWLVLVQHFQARNAVTGGAIRLVAPRCWCQYYNEPSVCVCVASVSVTVCLWDSCVFVCSAVKELCFASSCTAVVDTGTSYIGATEEVLTALMTDVRRRVAALLPR
jgi:hypothetical protein